ncbi:MAG: cytochrome P450 [Chloroflexi bacterium]|nr:MAG: cytochrome P450 [Chloroflexota bacterium]
MGAGEQADRFTFDPAREGFDPSAPGVMDDPYPYYAVLRERDPVHHNGRLGMYFLSRYDDVLAAARDHTRFVRGQQSRYYDDFGPAARILVGDSLFTKDPPHHGRLKGVIGRAFTRTRVDALRPRIEELCRGLLDELDPRPGGSRFDLVRALSQPLPFLVICEILGIPTDDRDDFQRWSADVVPIIDPFPRPAVKARGEAACTAMVDYLMLLLYDRRRMLRAGARPPGLLTSLVELAEGGEQISSSELIMLCGTLVIAGIETVTNLICCTVRALLEHPIQLEALRLHPELYANLADEALRYYPTGQYTPRETAENVVLSGTSIPSGSRVVLLRGSANRDGRRFANPDEFDLRRPNIADHLGFGDGPTFCIGAGLARIEVQVAIRQLLERLTPVRITRWVQRPSKLIWGPGEVELEYACTGLYRSVRT